jgi:tRNA-Thr(GGU) m(6)t(6)A37 methyltransferase TsaA
MAASSFLHRPLSRPGHLSGPSLILMLAVDPRTNIPPKDYADAFHDAARKPIVLSPIGHVESPYRERFGTPRQPVVTAQVSGGGAQDGTIVITAGDLVPDALRDLDGFSHLWIISYMHLNCGWKPLIRPPRGPKNVRRGLLATRAPHRPNQIALSAVRVTHVDAVRGRIGVRGLDLIDGTPVLDVKPCTAHADPKRARLTAAARAHNLSVTVSVHADVPPFDSFGEAAYGWIEELDDALAPDRLDYWPPPPHLRASTDVEDLASDDSSATAEPQPDASDPPSL